MNIVEVSNMSKSLLESIKKVIIGRDDTIEMVIVALLSGGNVLIEDVPGSGKTMLAKSLAASINGDFKRIQMTPDLLPADITGINYFNAKTSEFQFIKGPVFTNILLADEINRSTPKTQSGLLECMEEKQVTVEGKTYILDSPFMVIATQNPVDNQGVFPLPEAQMDRFLMKLRMDYTDYDSAVQILKTHMDGNGVTKINPVTTAEIISIAQKMVINVEVKEDMLKYITSLTIASRNNDKVLLGISQRGALAIVRASQAYAAYMGREFVIPDDIKKIFPYVCAHRIIMKNSERMKNSSTFEVVNSILDTVDVPTEAL